MTSKLLIIASITGCFFVSPVLAADVQAENWPAKGKIIGKNDKKSEDISGIACTPSSGFPRTCLVIDDNLQSAQEVTLEDGKLQAGKMVPLIGNGFDEKPLELDGEGVAFDNGIFYVIGSHGHPRDSGKKLEPDRDKKLIAARIAAASQIAKVALGADGSLTAQGTPLSLTRAIAGQPELAALAATRLEKNGLTIEGVAIKDGRLYAGFRSPILADGRAPVLSVGLDALTAQGEIQSKLFRLALGKGIGIRDLVRDGDHFLVLAGPSADGPGKYTIFSWDGMTDDGTVSLVALTDIKKAGDNRKAEALLSLDGDGADKKFLVLFDGEKEGAPLAITLP